MINKLSLQDAFCPLHIPSHSILHIAYFSVAHCMLPTSVAIAYSFQHICLSVAYCLFPSICRLPIGFYLLPIAGAPVRGWGCWVPYFGLLFATPEAWGPAGCLGSARTAMGHRRRHGAFGCPRGPGVGGGPTHLRMVC